MNHCIPRLLTTMTVVLSLAFPVHVRAQALWQANGSPFCTLPRCGGWAPRIVPDGAHGAVVAWQLELSQTSFDISANRILATGQVHPGWPDDIGGPPITRSIESQFLADLTTDGSGGAFVVWDDRRNALNTGSDIYMQHVLGDGQIAPGWPPDGGAVATSTEWEESAQVRADGQGGVFVIWASPTAIFLQRLQSDGFRYPGWPAEGLRLNDPVVTGSAWHAGGVLDGQGGCLVVTMDNRRGLGAEVYVHRTTGDGQIAPGWPANGRRVVDASSEQPVRGGGHAVSDGLGGLYIGWSANITDQFFGNDIYATHVQADGSVAAGWPATGLPVAVQPNTQYLTSAVPDGQGGVLLTWGDERDHDNFPARVYVQRLGPEGTLPPGWQPQGNPMSDLPGYHGAPVLAPDGHGGGFVAFQEAFGGRGFVQRFRGDGTRPSGWPTTGLPLVDPSISSSTRQQDIVITPDDDGGAIVVWNDSRNGTSNRLYAQRYSGADPTAALTALVRFETLPDRVTLVWSRGDDAPADVRVERQDSDVSWSTLDRSAFAANGSLEYADRAVIPGERYFYRLAWTDATGEHHTAETEVQVPLAVALALDGLRPNPAVGDPHVVFSLPGPGETTVELIDLVGRVVRREQANRLGAGRHVLRLASGGRLRPGVYWVRLRHDGRTLTAKGMVVR